jgi:periplasmic protein CpxP/Spy
MGGMADMGGGMGGGPGMMGGRHGERMLDSVGATAEQKTQLRQIMDAARTELKPLREAAQGLHRQMQALFAQPTVDARAVETLRQQLQANREQSSKRMTQAMLDASRVLTPEQRKQMAERSEQRRGMMQRHRAERQSLQPGAASAPR